MDRRGERRRPQPHQPHRAGLAAGLAEARARGFRDDIRSEGKLLVSGGGLARPAPTPGSYSCRLVTLGRSAKRGPAFEKFKPFFCYIDVEGELFTIVKQTGSQRPPGACGKTKSRPG